jgi:hypothetical protein
VGLVVALKARSHQSLQPGLFVRHAPPLAPYGPGLITRTGRSRLRRSGN